MTIPAQPPPEARIYTFTTLNAPDAAKLARDHVAWLLHHNACPVETDTARLLVSEIVTNAHQHTTTPVICLTTTIRPAGVRVAVYDTHPVGLSTPLDGPPTILMNEHGRGLSLLQTCASSWGYKLHGGPNPFGKTVYFVLLTNPTTRQDPT
jgi:anti-sigma regulatory factor (Ser/Thr protein kinase)